MNEARISTLEEELKSVKSDIKELKSSFSIMMESFKEDANKILIELESIKSLHNDKMIDIISLTTSLISKVQKVKGGIDRFQNEILKSDK
tara:strand:- start:6236 stop:6505 length:270 start_codon:yes stop_codon:yes gene_type:complete